ncbi:hypothetical protein [Winogradskyella sp. PG-2]|uniref:hypothetical protein n=1 Tax=Winogradskyella sp. PG-2 TaxID=754409 RepID=UPI0005F04F49|nr:hypothetical protein [Winogradskyella sp. PG-2]
MRHRISSSLQHEFPVLEGEPPRIPIWDFKKNLKIQDTLRLKVSNRIEIENKMVPLNKLSKVLKGHINESSVIEYIYDDNVTYQDYINVLSAHKMAVWELRGAEVYSEIVESIYRNQFSRDEELNKERDRLRERYPFRITERFE